MYHLAFFTGTSCHDCYMPDLPVWHQRVRLPAAVTKQSLDLILPVRALENQVYIQPDLHMTWVDTGTAEERMLATGESARIKWRDLTVLIRLTTVSRSATVMRKYQLPAGRSVSIGTDSANDICLEDGMVSSLQGDITLNNGVCVYQDRSQNGTYIGGNRLHKGRATLQPGDVISIGELRMVYLGNALAVNQPDGLKQVRLPAVEVKRGTASLSQGESDASAFQEYHRAPRIVEMPETELIKIEGPGGKNAENSMPLWMTIGPSATMVFPMMLAGLVTGRDMLSMGVMMGGSAALAVTWGVINANYRKKQGAENEQKRQDSYRRYIAETEDELSALAEKERIRVHEQYLSLERCLQLPVSRHRLWERMNTHDDFLFVRLGTGDIALPSAIQVPEEKLSMVDDELRDEPIRLKRAYGTIHDAPVTVDLKAHPIVGVIGSRTNPYLLQSMVVQLSAVHSYHDVRICIVTQERYAPQWAWAKWLPHVYMDDNRSQRLLVMDPDRMEEILSEMENVHSMRAEYMSAQADRGGASVPLPWYVIICTDPQLIEKHPITKHVIDQALGFTIVMQAASVDRLPKETDLIIQASAQQGGIYTNRGDMENVRFEWPERERLNTYAHAIAPIRVADATETTAIPITVSFLDNYHVRDIRDLDVWRFWSENHAYDGLKAMVGLAAGGQPFVLDISDKVQSHGPHGLVAGTTGSGKSVMLQTYILSLAVNYSPKEIQFILIDYKGGGTAQVFEGMPHIAGIIDNQEGEKTIQRALASIKGEISRREQTFKRLKITHIDEYIRYFNNDPQEKPLAHLVVIVDEFAEMAKEQPEFMKELVSTARVGRTLGMHLILATQKPSNSVSDEIWSNTRFRICLRVATRGDSNEMLKRPDAAFLRGMGRCYVQVGNDEIFEQVQTSYSGADYAPEELSAEERPRILDSIGQAVQTKKSVKARSADGEKETQMSAVLRRIRQVADEHSMPNARRLWLEPLRTTVLLDELPALRDSGFDGAHWPNTADEPLVAWYGLVDNTAVQAYQQAGVDFTHNHNHLILGPAGTGKTALIQTIVLSLALRYTPAQVSFYIFSLTSSTLDGLRGLPHTGDVVLKNHPDEARRMLLLIEQEDRRRRQLLEAHATDSFTQYNRLAETDAALERLPAMVVMVDRLSSLLGILSEEQYRRLITLLTESASVGIYFMVTALNWSNDEVPNKLKESFTGIALNIGERDVVREVLGLKYTLAADAANITQTPGRGLCGTEEGVFEMQTAVYGTADGIVRNRMVSELAERMNAAWKGQRPRGIVRVPENLTLREMLALPGFDLNTCAMGDIPVGVDQVMGTPIFHRFREAATLPILGPGRTGKTTAMLNIAEMLRRQGAKVILIGSGAQLHDWSQTRPEARVYAADSADIMPLFRDELLPETKRRLEIYQTYAHKGGVPEEVARRELPLVVVAVDELNRLVDANRDNGVCTVIGNTALRGNGVNMIYLFSVTPNDLTTIKGLEPMKSVLQLNTGILTGGYAHTAWNVPATLEIKRARLSLGEAMYLTPNGYQTMVMPG